jgi:uncharacterized protein (TIGR03067 family)
MKALTNLLEVALLSLLAACSGQSPADDKAGASRPDTQRSVEANQAVPPTKGKQVSVDQAILGTWVMDPDHRGTLGAFELFMGNVNTTPDIYMEQSLVISTNAVIHRHRMPRAGGPEVVGQTGGHMTRLPVARDGTGEKNYVIEYHYTLNTSTTPHEIDLHWIGGAQDQSSKGIYKVEDGVLWLAISLDGNDPRPRDFSGSAPRLVAPLYKATKSK